MFRLRAALFTFVLCAGLNQAATSTDVKISSGKLKGVVSGDVLSFKGVPFAAPPVGPNRWRDPQPVTPWAGVRDAGSYAADCMQLPFPSDAAPLGTKPSEDCLYLNVWEPAEHGKKLPVMFWIYGGGFVNGGSSPAVYDGSQFAKRGVIFVSFNYRLGRFGFFAHPALTKESSSGLLGNYAYLDQVAALQWVHKNIGAFGGDPSNVTIFGESAGGMSVEALLVTPLARGLFNKAIIESGGGRTGIFPPRHVREPLPGIPSGEQIGLNFAKDAGIAGEDAAALQALRALPADRLVNGLNMASMQAAQATYPGPMVDGRILPETVEDAFRAGHQTKVPLIAGANSMDIGFSFAKTMDEVFAPFGENKQQAEEAYQAQAGGDMRAISYKVAADRMMIEPARFLVREMAAAGQPVYEFRFSYVAESMRKEWPGAPHATEIPFVFDTVKARYQDKLAPADEALAQQANEYWVAFAKTGDPNSGNRPKWPGYTPASDEILDFTDSGPVAGPDPWKARLDVTAELADSPKGLPSR